MKYKIGDKLRVKAGCEEKCDYYGSNSDHIVIANVRGGTYYYSIRNKDGGRLNRCSCFTDEHLEPYDKTLEHSVASNTLNELIIIKALLADENILSTDRIKMLRDYVDVRINQEQTDE